MLPTEREEPIYRKKMILIRRYRQVEYNTRYSFTMKIIRTYIIIIINTLEWISIIKYQHYNTRYYK